MRMVRGGGGRGRECVDGRREGVAGRATHTCC